MKVNIHEETFKSNENINVEMEVLPCLCNSENVKFLHSMFLHIMYCDDCNFQINLDSTSDRKQVIEEWNKKIISGKNKTGEIR